MLDQLDQIRETVKGKKTYIVAGMTVAVCIAELLGYDVVPGIDKSNAMATALDAVIGMTIRAGIAAKA